MRYQNGRAVNIEGKLFRSIVEAADYFKGRVTKKALYVRLRKTSIIEKLTPLRPNNGTPVTYNGKRYESVKAMARDLKLAYKKVSHRITAGWTVEDAVRKVTHGCI